MIVSVHLDPEVCFHTIPLGSCKDAMPAVTVFNSLNAEKSQPSSGDLNRNNIIKQSNSYIEAVHIQEAAQNKLWAIPLRR